MRPEVAFFDLDGTLTDPYEGITRCIEHALVSLGVESPPRPELRHMIGPPLRATFGQYVPEDQVEEAVRLYRERFAPIGLFENEVYAGIKEMLSDLKSGELRLFVATSKPAIYADKILRHFGLRDAFEHVYGSELDGSFDNKGELLDFALNRQRLNREACAMVGDRDVDMRAAKQNGLLAVGVLYGYGTKDELSSAGADAIVDSPSALENLLLANSLE